MSTISSTFDRQINNPNLFAMALDSAKLLFEALTYDDVLLVPAYSEVLPRETSTITQLTENIRLNIPIVR